MNLGRLLTNIALVDVDDVEIELGAFARYDRDHHRELGAEHGDTHVFRRRGDTLECVRLDPDSPNLGETLRKMPVRRLGGLLNMLVEESIARFLQKSPARLLFRRRRPLQLISLEPKNDIAHILFGARTHGRLPLHVRRGFALEARTLRVEATRRVGLAIDARSYSRIEATCADLLADGFDLRGLYVQTQEESSDPRMEAKRNGVGAVDRIEHGRIILGRDRPDENLTEVQPDTTWLDPSPAALDRLLAHYVGPDAHQRLFGERSEISSGPPRFDRADRFRERLTQANDLELAPGATCRIGQWLSASRCGASELTRPRFIVGPGPGREVPASKDVLRHGPRQQPEALDPQKPIQACVICEKGAGPKVESFMAELADGLGAHRGLGAAWRLPALKWRMFEANTPDASSYERACRDALDAGPFHLAFVQPPDRTSDLFGEQNPYLVAKAKFLARGVPVQEFRDETRGKPQNIRQWALGGIALQVFAKLGGIPWLLKAPAAPPWQVVLGLGSAQLGTGKFGQKECVVGLATAFSGDGTYWLTEASKAVTYEEHEQALGETAVNALKSAREQMGWRPGDAVQVIVHSFKDFRGAHADVILKAVEELKKEGHAVALALVHVVENHPFLLFDQDDAHKIPGRGVLVPLGDREALLTMQGPDEVRNEERGFPDPLMLKLHPSSTLTDLPLLATQTLAFAAHNWRNYSPTALPVTILYAELIAKLLGRLGNLPKWDPDVLRGEVGRLRWFL